MTKENQIFSIKRLVAGSNEVSTLNNRAFELLACVGDTDAFTMEKADQNNFPSLIEVEHAPMLDSGIAVTYHDHELMPPSAHMLYICLKCPKSDIDNYTLFLAPQVVRDDENVDAEAKKDTDPIKAEFLQYHTDDDKFVDEKLEVIELEPFELKFDKARKTPETTEPSDEVSSDHGLYYIRLLFLIGENHLAEEVEFNDTQIVDLTDDSPAGFPAYLKLWVARSDASVSDKALRKETEKNLLFVDTMPDHSEQESGGRDALEDLGKMDDEAYEQID